MEARLQSPRRTPVIGAFIVVFIIASFAFFWRLGINPIANADEGVHALVTREMREGGDWLTMHIRGDYYFRKPPLSFWIRAVTQNIAGENELTDRIPSALAGVGTALLIAGIAWCWTKRWTVTLLAGAMLPFMPSTFIHTFRTGETDGLLIFLSTLTGFLLWRSMKRPWLLVAAALTTGLGFMTKTVAAGAVPIGFLLTLLIFRRWPYRWRHVLTAAAVFLVVALPWHIYEIMKYGREFWDEYVGFHIVQRVETKLHVTPKLHAWYWYLRDIMKEMFPWSFLIIPAAAGAFARIRRRDDDAFLPTFLLLWSFGTVVLFTLAATKLAWYVAPAFPAFILLIAVFIMRPFTAYPRWVQFLTGACVAVYLYDSFHQYRTGLGSLLTLSFLGPKIAFGIVCAGVLAILVVAYRHSRIAGERTLRMLAAVFFIVIALMSVVVYKRYAVRVSENSFRTFKNEIEVRDASAPVYVFNIGYITSPLAVIYWQGPNHARELTALKENTDALRSVVAEKHGAFIVFEKTQEIPEDVGVFLEHIRDFSDLSLYRVL